MHKPRSEKKKILVLLLQRRDLLETAVAKGGPCQGRLSALRVLSGVW